MKAAFPYLIAEIASAHEGDPALCRRMVRLAASTGADAVKLQLFNRDGLMSRFHPKFDSFGEIEIAPAEWRAILAEAGTLGVDVVVEAFDELSLALAEDSGVVAAYKLPTSDIGNLPFLRAMAATGRPVMLGVGGALLAEVGKALDVLRQGGCPRVILLHGFQAYPTRVEDTNLAKLVRLARETGAEVGYADHVDATDRELARVVPAMALAAGATVIEKHFTDARSRQGRDRYSALNPDEFADFAAFIRRLAPAIGSDEDVLNEAETTYRHQMKRQAVAARPLPKGAALAADMVAYKRTNRAGLGLDDVRRLDGRALGRDLAADEPILEEDLP